MMAFDTSGEGKITKEMLPERMHTLFEKGDKNKDGVLDRAEIERLAKEEARQPPPGPRGRGQGPPPPGRGGRGPGG
jgi:hypothetical protein